MSINRREFLTYSAAAGVVAAPVVAAHGSTHTGLQPVPDGDLPGQPIPDKLLNLTVMGVPLPHAARLFKKEWWLAAYFDLTPYDPGPYTRDLRQQTYTTRHGHLPDHRLPDLMAGCVAVYQEQYYQRHGLLPRGYHTVEQAVWGVYPIWYPHFPVCFPFGLNSAGYPASPRSAETEAEVRRRQRVLDEAHRQAHSAEHRANFGKKMCFSSAGHHYRCEALAARAFG